VSDGNARRELIRVLSSVHFVLHASSTNGVNPIHICFVRGTSFVVALHESNERDKLYAVWIDASKRSSRTERYVPISKTMQKLPQAIRDEVQRLRPILSRRRSEHGDFDALAERSAD